VLRPVAPQRSSALIKLTARERSRLFISALDIDTSKTVRWASRLFS
jgi:hypothetical protein